MPRPPIHPCYAAGIIERFDNAMLIRCEECGTAETRHWKFPRGPVREGESPEEAMRRIGREQLGVHLEIVVGQPPILVDVNGRRVELRYFFCGIVSGTLDPGPDEPLRWVSRGHLREYDFDEPSRPVVAWLLEP